VKASSLYWAIRIPFAMGRRFLPLSVTNLLLLCLAGGSAPAQRAPAQAAEVKQAEAVVSEFVNRLHKTLSFAAASEGLLITSPAGRNGALDGVDREAFPELDQGLEPGLLALGAMNKRFAHEIDDVRLREMSFALWDYFYLGFLGAVPDCDEPKKHDQDVCPLLRRSAKQQEVNNTASFDAALKTARQVVVALRKRLPQKPFESFVYKSGLLEADKNLRTPPHRLDPSDRNGRSPWGDVFLVYQEGFAFYVVIVEDKPRIWKIAVPWMD